LLRSYKWTILWRLWIWNFELEINLRSSRIDKTILKKILLGVDGNEYVYNNMIPAVKYIRDKTKWGLRESKNYVDDFVTNELKG